MIYIIVEGPTIGMVKNKYKKKEKENQQQQSQQQHKQQDHNYIINKQQHINNKGMDRKNGNEKG